MAADDLNDLYRDRQSLLSQIVKLKKEIDAFNKSDIENAKKSNDLNVKRQMLAEGLRDTNEIIRKEQQNFYVESELAANELSGIHSRLGDIDKERIELMIEAKGLTQESIDRTNRVAELNREISQLSKEDTVQRRVKLGEITHLVGLLQKQEGISDSILNNLEQQTRFAKDLSALSNDEIENLNNKSTILDKVKDTIGGVLGISVDLLNKTEGQVGALIIGAGQIAGKFGEVRQQLGGINSASTTFMSLLDSDAVGTFTAISNQMGSTEEATLGTQLNLSLMSRTMGISGEQAGNLVGMFSRMEGGSIETAENLMVSTREFAKQRGVIPSQVMADLAGSADSFALFAKEGGENIAEAAVYARQLGTEYSTLEGVAMNLLDFENSINQELELSALLGRQINLDRARSLAYQGEIEEAVSATLDELGGVEEFNRMDIFQKQKAAELLGVSVGEMQKMVDNNENIGNQSELIADKFSRWNSAMNVFVNEYLGTSVTALGGMVATSGELFHGFQGISALARGLKNTTLVQWGIEKARLGWMKLRNLFTAKELAMSQSRLATEQAIAATEKSRTGMGGGKKGGGIMGMMKGINVGSILKGAAAIGILAGSFWVFGKAVQQFEDVNWKNVFIGIGALTSLGIVASLIGLAGPALIAGAAGMLVIASASWVFGKALQEIGMGLGIITSLSVTLDDMISKVGGITQLTGALFGLAGSLTTLGLAGMVSLPGMMALSVVGSVVDSIGLAGGEDGETSVVQENHEELIQEIRGLRQDLQDGKIAVYIDREKVSRNVATGINNSSVNNHGLL